MSTFHQSVSFLCQESASCSTMSLSTIADFKPNLSYSSNSHCFLSETGTTIRTFLVPDSNMYLRTSPASIVFPRPTSSASTSHRFSMRLLQRRMHSPGEDWDRYVIRRKGGNGMATSSVPYALVCRTDAKADSHYRSSEAPARS